MILMYINHWENLKVSSQMISPNQPWVWSCNYLPIMTFLSEVVISLRCDPRSFCVCSWFFQDVMAFTVGMCLNVDQRGEFYFRISSVVEMFIIWMKFNYSILLNVCQCRFWSEVLMWAIRHIQSLVKDLWMQIPSRRCWDLFAVILRFVPNAKLRDWPPHGDCMLASRK